MFTPRKKIVESSRDFIKVNFEVFTEIKYEYGIADLVYSISETTVFTTAIHKPFLVSLIYVLLQYIM